MSHNLLDTSIWIEYFRHHAPYYEIVHRMLEDNEAFCNEIILAELLQNARSKREVQGINVIRECSLVPLTTDIWIRAGYIAYELRREGITKGLLDLAIGVTAINYGLQLWTLNLKDFQPLLPYGLQYIPTTQIL